MFQPEPSQRLLVSGLFVSAVVHVALFVSATGFVRENDKRELAEVREAAAAPVEPEKQIVKLGIDESFENGIAWLGYKEATPHQGVPAPIDQSAMTPAPGAPSPAPAAPVPPAPRVAPAPLITSQQVQEAAQSLADLGNRLSEAIRSAALSAPTPASEPVAPPMSAAAPSGAAGTAGLNSDKEAIGTSVKNAPQVKLGQVAAANGLDIQTKSPKWSTTTLLSQRPANPTIQITFGRDGTVIRASFAVEGRRTLNTGSAEVDEPLISAVYSWVARGKRLAELTSMDPKGEVTIMITVILNG